MTATLAIHHRTQHLHPLNANVNNSETPESCLLEGAAQPWGMLHLQTLKPEI
jgi:hypothetical protein